MEYRPETKEIWRLGQKGFMAESGALPRRVDAALVAARFLTSICFKG